MKKLKNLKELPPEERDLQPQHARRSLSEPVSKFELPAKGIESKLAYELIHDELMLDGNARLNLATFVTTWMEPEAVQLMSETFDKNMIDKDEYPQTAEIEERCVNIVSRLFNAPETGVGTSTIGSSEAVMLAGLALKWRWRDRRKAEGKSEDRPNLVLGSNVQVVWEKFCRYWDVEAKYLPVEEGRWVISPEQVVEAVDENTIGVVAILGTTYTGEYEPIEEIHDALVELAKKTGVETPLHIDAASGGFVAPFVDPDLLWDFRLPLVKSINVSGHKYGLVYPGVGWVVWKSHEDLPEGLIFHVNYLGGDMPTFTLNFSRPGNQVIGQYYNFLSLGHSGYTRVMSSLRECATWLSGEIEKLGPFELLSDGSAVPAFAFRVVPGTPFTVFEISDALRARGWQVPAYSMPDNATDVSVLRVVVRDGFNLDLARILFEDLVKVVKKLEARPSEAGADDTSGQFAH